MRYKATKQAAPAFCSMFIGAFLIALAIVITGCVKQSPTPSAQTAASPPASGHAKVKDEHQLHEAKLDQVIGAVLDSEFGPSGFTLAPQEINYQESAEYKKLDQDSVWKVADHRLGVLYAAKQKPVNDRLKPKAIACRPHLIEAIQWAAALYGGGSASSALANMAEAQTEWIIANLDKSEPRVRTDDDIKKVLPTVKDVYLPEAIYDEKVKAVFSELGKAEKHLTKNQVNVLRREFIAFFK